MRLRQISGLALIIVLLAPACTKRRAIALPPAPPSPAVELLTPRQTELSKWPEPGSKPDPQTSEGVQRGCHKKIRWLMLAGGAAMLGSGLYLFTTSNGAILTGTTTATQQHSATRSVAGIALFTGAPIVIVSAAATCRNHLKETTAPHPQDEK